MRAIVVAPLLASLAVACGSADDQTAPSSDAASTPRTAAVTAERLIAADAEPGQWLSHGRTYGEQRFSPLDQINEHNVGELGLAWYADIDTERGQEATPIVVDGVMYLTTAWSMVNALRRAHRRASSGATTRRCSARSGARACCDVVNRGVAAWNGEGLRRRARRPPDRARRGDRRAVWEVQTTDPALPYTITGAPRIVKGKVIIGNGGAEYRRARLRLRLRRRDRRAGLALLHRARRSLEAARAARARPTRARPGSGEWWKVGGGGTVWDSHGLRSRARPALRRHRQRHAVEPAPAQPGGGDNLYLSSIVALDPDTGEYIWHYQTTPGETVGLHRDAAHDARRSRRSTGAARRVLMQAPKNGFFYVLDARDRRAALGRQVRARHLGDARRPGDRPPGRGAGSALRRRGSPVGAPPGAGRRAQLAPDGVQPADRPRSISPRARTRSSTRRDRNFNPIPRVESAGSTFRRARRSDRTRSPICRALERIAWDPAANRGGVAHRRAPAGCW